MNIPKKKSAKQLQKEIDKFNEKYKIGDIVKLQTDSKEIKEVKIYHEATIMGGHTAVGWFEGHGSYLLSRVIEIK